jgi:hypothetical protein
MDRTPEWEYDVAYKLVDLYVRELTERRDKQMLNLEGVIEAYLYTLGRLRASEKEIERITSEIRRDMKEAPEPPGKSGMKQAIGDKKLSAGLLKALEGL